MGKNVLIPLILLNRMIELLECRDICGANTWGIVKTGDLNMACNYFQTIYLE